MHNRYLLPGLVLMPVAVVLLLALPSRPTREQDPGILASRVTTVPTPLVPVNESRSIWSTPESTRPASAGTAGPTQTPSPAPPSDRQEIPGLTPASLMALLEGSGFRCSPVAIVDRQLRWTCSQQGNGNYLITIGAAHAGAARTLSAEVTDSANDAVAAVFLASVARLVCRDINGELAHGWVMSHVIHGGDTNIGPLRLLLTGSPGSRTLHIAPKDERG